MSYKFNYNSQLKKKKLKAEELLDGTVLMGSNN